MIRIDIAGKRFGKWTVLKYLGMGKGYRSRWLCVCDCGTKKIVTDQHQLTSGHSKSCGCYRSEATIRSHTTHGMAGNKTYRSWFSMHDRCRRKSDKKYHVYGGRGIKVCPRWKKFENFLLDMGIKPEGMTLDRIDVNEGYSPSNCRWASHKTQANNRQATRYYTFNGKTATVSQFAEEYNLPTWAVRQRVVRGWSIEKALTYKIEAIGSRPKK